jgi:SAM-dependent methyltransferase
MAERLRQVDQYVSGEYLAKNPDWGRIDSAWKARKVAELLERHDLRPAHIVDVGCGAGAVLHHLSDDPRLARSRFSGFDISPQSIALAREYETGRVRFYCGAANGSERADMALALDVFEHVPDYLGFLRLLRDKADAFVFHIPLDMNAQALLRDAQIELRRQVGHLHYCSKATALHTLEDCGYRVVDWRYTAAALELADRSRPTNSVRTRAANLMRRMAFPALPDLTVKLLGGYSLLVLASAG